MALPCWDFRQILNVRPDSYSFTCVGTTKKGARCGNKRPSLADADLSNAASILDRMDQLPSLKNSYKYLDELADSTLCKRWHRYAQTQQVVNRWRTTIMAYAEELRMAEQRAALAKAREELLTIRANALRLEAMVVEDNEENPVPVGTANIVEVESVPPKSVRRFSTTGFVQSNLEDPFTESTGTLSTNVNLPVTTFGTGTPDTDGFYNSASKYGSSKSGFAASTTESVSTSSGTPPPIPKLDVVTSRFSTNKATTRTYIIKQDDSPTLPPYEASLPSPPITPLSLSGFENKVEDGSELKPSIAPLKRVKSFSSTEPKDLKVDIQRSKTVTSKRTNFAFEFGPKSAISINTFRFELPAEVPIALETKPKSEPLSLDSMSPPSTFRFGFAPTSSTGVPLPVIPRKSSRRQRVPRLNTSLSTSKPAPVDITRNVRMSYISTTSDKEAEIETIMAPRCTSMPTNQVKEASPYPISPATPVNKYTEPEVILAPALSPLSPSPLSLNPPKEAHQPFGYAVVTPTPTRYSTYLPARQQHGLVTPPETPENLPPHPSRKAPETPPLSLERDEDHFTAIASPKPLFSIPRKPIPPRSSTSLKRRNEVRWRSSDRVRVCQVCRTPQYVGDTGGVRCPCKIGEEREVVKAGCLDNLGWARLRESVIDKMRSKVSEGEVLQMDTPKKNRKWKISL